MNKYLILIVLIYILSRKRKIYEGITNKENDENDENKENDENDENDESDENDENDENNEDCPYRKKTKLGRMCNEKWGEPECNEWIKTKGLKNLEEKKISNVLKGYYSNNFMYEIDYENYPTILIDDSNIIEIDENTPRGVHSSFFS
tara:strand:- start:2372 stop:2812 length:441 start_codon:yes stop_codon:yes gene_type:complete